jgi:hypothetical protein
VHYGVTQAATVCRTGLAWVLLLTLYDNSDLSAWTRYTYRKEFCCHDSRSRNNTSHVSTRLSTNVQLNVPLCSRHMHSHDGQLSSEGNHICHLRTERTQRNWHLRCGALLVLASHRISRLPRLPDLPRVIDTGPCLELTHNRFGSDRVWASHFTSCGRQSRRQGNSVCRCM